jgi:hypothetical protein
LTADASLGAVYFSYNTSKSKNRCDIEVSFVARVVFPFISKQPETRFFKRHFKYRPDSHDANADVGWEPAIVPSPLEIAYILIGSAIL